MKNIMFSIMLLVVSTNVHSAGFLFVPSAGTGTVSERCYYLSIADCQAWIDTIYNTPPPPPQDITFAWSASGTINGMHCTQIIEGAQPAQYTWDDNYFCASEDIGIQWSGAGPISGQQCTQVIEGAAPPEYTWDDNYLCLPQDSRVTFTWSGAGPISGMQCTQWLETADPYTWDDNYMCHDVEPLPDPEPLAPPPDPTYTLTVSDLELEEEYGVSAHACILYSYTIPGSNASGNETVKVFTADWSQEVSNEGAVANFPSQANERCANFTTPSTPGDYRAQVCLTVDGPTACNDAEFSVVSGGGSPPPSGGPDIALYWYDTLNESWVGANTFDVGDTVRVLFGAQNNESSQQTFDADLKVFDTDGTYLFAKTGSITMPGGSNKDTNGDDPRFMMSFENSGAYQVQLCVGDNCKEMKSLTVTGGGEPPGPDISIHWWNNFKTSDNSWSTPSVFAAGETFAVMFGGQNNEAYDATFDANLNVSDSSGNHIATKTGSITMPAGSNGDINGDHPRFTTDFTNAGNYNVQLCIGSVCGSSKAITIQ